MTPTKECLAALPLDTAVRLYLFSGHTVIGKLNERVDDSIIELYREADHVGPLEHHSIDIDAVVGFTIFDQQEKQG